MTETIKNTAEIKEEERLIRLLRQGDQFAFELLYKKYFPPLAQFLYRYVHSTHIAEDLVHNVFYSLWNNRDKLHDVDSLRPYLYRACRNQAYKYLRKEHETLTPLEIMNSYDNSHDHSPDEFLEISELERAVVKAVSDMPERRRQIYLMHRENGLTYREIAEVLDLSVKTVETQIGRSLKYLRDKLAPFLPILIGAVGVLATFW